uniref:RNA-binding region-containing protein 3 n=1 Tax=Eptatretus burgeri TaxID=7764 RepID=A0A8C4N5I8_EPTBU
MLSELGKSENCGQQRCTLLVRHLPACLSPLERADLLRHFGATEVRMFRDRGHMKNAAFASFCSEAAATKALGRLHQLEVLGHTLVVQYAKGQQADRCGDFPETDKEQLERCDKKKVINQQSQQKRKSLPPDDTIAPQLGLNFPWNPHLKYKYPPVNNNTLVNISNALIGVPLFYEQVLHLMNKMNLPAPFGPAVTQLQLMEFVPPLPPPLPPEIPTGSSHEMPPLPRQLNEFPQEVEMDVSSEEESELESEDDEESQRLKRVMGQTAQTLKRPLQKKRVPKRKIPKIKDLLKMPKMETSSSQPSLNPSEVFEHSGAQALRKIEFHLDSQLMQEGHVERKQEDRPVQLPRAIRAEDKEESTGFGKIYPVPEVPLEEKGDEDEEDDMPREFISRKELSKHRLSKEEMIKLPVFKKYEPGEPTCRLYVKNLSKQTEDKDLKYIFGRYVDFSLDVERNMFDIRLMKEGRMKGQAFVGLPSERVAEKALRDVCGFVLHGKPLVIQFARSARPKEDAKGSKRRRD